jgi:hypothetical protein
MLNKTPIKKVSDIVFLTPQIIDLMTYHQDGLISDEVYTRKLRKLQELINEE